jgi:DNA repair exonuclease SbcCD ATPase subunit
MKLAELTVAGFRGFNRTTTISLDGDVVIVAGINGAGKTSFLDAIQWLISGDVPRLRPHSVRPTKDDYLSSRYAASPAFVEAVFADGETKFVAARKGVGSTMETTVDLPDGTQLRGPDADNWLISLIAEPAVNEGRSLRTFVLQQDDVKEFLCATDPKERYTFLATFSGVGEAQQLDRQLQSEVRRLREVARTVRTELDSEALRLDSFVRDLSESRQIAEALRQPRPPEIPQAVARVAQRAGIVAAPDDQPLSVVSRIRVMLGEVDELVEEAAAAMRRAASTYDARVFTEPENLGELNAAAARAEEEAGAAERASVELERRVQKSMEERERLRQFAALALEQLGETCPVCERPYDRDHAVAHLQSLLGDDSEIVAIRRDSDAARERAAAARRSAASARQAVNSAQKAVAEQTAALEAAQKLEDAARAGLAEARSRLGLEESAVDIHHDVDEIRHLLDQLRADLRNAELDAQTLAQREVSASRLKSLESQVEAQQQLITELRARVSTHEAALEQAQNVARWYGEQVVAATADAMQLSGPLLNDLYNRLEVHPSFRRFAFRYDRRYEAGQVRPWVYDDERRVDGNAAQVLSSAQLNALAVCLFLTMNLAREQRLQCAILDDPVQNMDDFNVISLVDVLRSIRGERQVIITTHDERLAILFWRKLRPLRIGERSIIVRLADWTPEGPLLDEEIREPALDEKPLQLVTA